MTKKIIAWLLLIVLTAGIAVGGTLAYLTDRDSEANVFTTGDVNIDLEEDFEDGATLIPGVSVTKTPTVTNKGPNAAWVWTTVAVPKNLTSVIAFTDKGAGWETWTSSETKIDGKEYTLYTVLHTEALDAGNVTNALFTSVSLNSSVDIDPNGNWYTVNAGVASPLGWNNSNGNPVVYVSAYAMQAEGFDTVAEAYEAYNTQWGTQGSEYATPPKIFNNDCIRYVAEGGSADAYKVNCDTIHRYVFSDGCIDFSELIIHEGIRKLENRSLAKAPTLTAVTLPNSLEIIEEGAFQQSSFKELEIPENVTYMGKQCMGACPELETIIIRAKNVTLGNYVARDCGKLKEVYIYSDTVTLESGSMYFTNKQTGDASQITFYVSNQEIADTLFNASYATSSFGMLIKNLDGTVTYYNTL